MTSAGRGPDTFVVIGAAAAVGAGTFAGREWGSLALLLTSLAVWLVAVSGVLAVRTQGHGSALVVVLFGLGVAAATNAAWRDAADDSRLLPRLAQDDTVVRVCGTVIERRPRSVEIDVRTVSTLTDVWTVRERVRAGGPVTKARPGERWCASGTVAPARTGRDEPPFLAADEGVRRGVGSVVRYAAAVVRSAYSDAARAALPDRQAGLLLGMTDGDVVLLDDKTMEAFRVTGMAHLVAVSGSNVAVVLAIVMVVSRSIIRRGRLIRALICGPPLVFFAFLTALEPSVLRAVVTAGLVVAVTASGRRADGLRASAVAFSVLVLVSPELLARPGFQLSFAATIGLILWAGPLTDRLVSCWPREPGRVATATAMAVATTIAAQIAVAPLLAVHFGQIPAVGGLANLVVAPLAGVVMVGGMATLTAASLWTGLDWAPATMRLLLDAILWVADVFSRLPLASVGVELAFACAITAGLAAVVTRNRARAVAVAVAVAAMSFTGGTAVVRSETGCHGPRVQALDIGQGTAVLIASGARAVLVDGGPKDGGVVGELSEAGVDRLDALFLSHPHADHVAGFVPVLERMDVGELVGPVTMAWGTGGEVVAAARAAGTRRRTTGAGDVFRYGPDITVEVISPPHGPEPPFSEDAINPYSLVLRATVAGTAVILPGDVEAETQVELTGAPLEAPILVAPHHGSADVHPGFVAAVAPDLTVVTVGENRYGHPTERALRLFGRAGHVLRTDHDGAITVCVRRDGVEVTTER